MFTTATALAGLGTVAYTLYLEPHWVKVERRVLAIENLDQRWHGKRIVQLSDLHISPRVSTGYIARCLKTVNNLAPDLVLITGDFMTCHGAEQIDEVLRLLDILNRRTPIFAVLGNHDYGAGWMQLDVAKELTDRLRTSGVAVLRNEVQELQGLRIIGVDDLWSGVFDLQAVRPHLDDGGSAIALCHNPDGVDLAGWEDYRGWIFAGHTHGGQCKPPFLPPPLLPVTNKRYTSGEFELGPGRRLYISRGVGHLLKARFNCRPEIACFDLQPS